ncbi:MAG: pantoate--beta-alanine ligase [Chromatocurvus sp.]
MTNIGVATGLFPDRKRGHYIMRTTGNMDQLQARLSEARGIGHRIAFVPTMGNLHAGHMQLVRRAKEQAEVVVVSIYVNPLQFGAGEDLNNYPRTLATDKEKLFAAGVQLLYTPETTDIYPQGMQRHTQVEVPDLSETLCGSSRPGHFNGVTTIVAKLFNIVRPDIALFGEKDFQQLSIVRKMASDLCMPVKVIGVPTVRDIDGLALSSRNSYLSPAQRRIAPLLHETLISCREAIACDFDNFLQLESHARMRLLQAGFTPDYFAIRDAHSLRNVTDDTEEIAILAAARLGTTRLIDNVRLSLNPASDWGMLATP